MDYEERTTRLVCLFTRPTRDRMEGCHAIGNAHSGYYNQLCGLYS